MKKRSLFTAVFLEVLLAMTTLVWANSAIGMTQPTFQLASPLPTDSYEMSNRCFGRVAPLFGVTDHHGIDLTKTTQGTPVLSIGGGYVVTKGSSPSFGEYVIVQHPATSQMAEGFTSLYSHLQRGSIVVHKDQSLAAGQKLGGVGNTGFSRGAHLYLELRSGQADSLASFMDNELIDPMDPKLGLAEKMVAGSRDGVDQCIQGMSALNRDTSPGANYPAAPVRPVVHRSWRR
jgi:murein DD-endopeptidase MepM/ murein hydrolase activator NlpD